MKGSKKATTTTTRAVDFCPRCFLIRNAPVSSVLVALPHVHKELQPVLPPIPERKWPSWTKAAYAMLPPELVEGIWMHLGPRQPPWDRVTWKLSRHPMLAVRKFISVEDPIQEFVDGVDDEDDDEDHEAVRHGLFKDGARGRNLEQKVDVGHPAIGKTLAFLLAHVLKKPDYLQISDRGTLGLLVRKCQRHEQRAFLDAVPLDQLDYWTVDLRTRLGRIFLRRKLASLPPTAEEEHPSDSERLRIGRSLLIQFWNLQDWESVRVLLNMKAFKEEPFWYTECVLEALVNQSVQLLRCAMERRGTQTVDVEYLVDRILDEGLLIGNPVLFALCHEFRVFDVQRVFLGFWRGMSDIVRYVVALKPPNRLPPICPRALVQQFLLLTTQFPDLQWPEFYIAMEILDAEGEVREEMREQMNAVLAEVEGF
ncbi:hypothetical protein HKX48_008667 [Thoreauomyces humboldtii]|nr:hypothetical protein HKX48_008667 [Thoreauomyces humboldtii]